MSQLIDTAKMEDTKVTMQEAFLDMYRRILLIIAGGLLVYLVGNLMRQVGFFTDIRLMLRGIDLLLIGVTCGLLYVHTFVPEGTPAQRDLARVVQALAIVLLVGVDVLVWVVAHKLL